jgi:hypothetical protein
VISGVMAILFFNIEQKAFSPEPYKVAFQEQGLYKNAPAIITDMVLGSAKDSKLAHPLLTLLSRDELQSVITELLPPDQLESLMDETIGGFFNYLNGSADSVTINLLPFKRSLVGDGGVRAFTQILLAQPDCTLEQVLTIMTGFFSNQSGLVLCKPPQEAMALVTPLIQTQLQFLAQNFPDNLTLAGSVQSGLFKFRSRLYRVRALMQLMPLVPLILLFVTTLLAIRSFYDWLRWWGIPFIATGAISMLLALIGAPVVRMFMEAVILKGNADMPIVFLEVMRNVTGSLVSHILRPVLIEGIILTLAGAGMVTGAFFLSRKRNLTQN